METKNPSHEILSQLSNLLESRTSRRLVVSVAGILSFFSMVVAFATASPSSDTLLTQQSSVMELEPALLALTSTDTELFYETQSRRGDTVAIVLRRLMITDAEAISFFKTKKVTQDLAKLLKPDTRLVASITSSGKLNYFTVPLKKESNQFYVIERKTGHLIATIKPLPLQRQVITKTAEVHRSLLESTDEEDIPEKIILQLSEVFNSTIDFQHDLKNGDRVSVIYETFNYLGRPVKTGRILAAEVFSKGKSYQTAWFSTKKSDVVGNYFTPDGKSMKKEFLHSPLEFSRVTSGFTDSRLHPVLNQIRAHKGIDFSAPTGTKVRSTGDGQVEFMNRQSGYGNTIVIKHKNSYSTLYAHLSAFAPNLKLGSLVKQGDLIGFVGNTGLSTGPHLHYEFRIKGTHINPLEIASPDAKSLNKNQVSEFKTATSNYFSSLNLLRQFQIAQYN